METHFEVEDKGLCLQQVERYHGKQEVKLLWQILQLLGFI